MGKLNSGKRAYALFLLGATTAIALPAQTSTTLQSFDSTDGLGSDPISPRWATSFITLHSFDSTDGALPQAALVQATNGNLYGTTPEVGANGGGTVFKITPAGTLTTLYNFCLQTNCTDGASPSAGLIQATNGNFYGTTTFGGVNGHGTVFKITPSGMLMTLYRFCSQSGCTDGEFPFAGLVQATNGNLYGTTFEGGTKGDGTVFKMTPSGALTTLHCFCSQPNCTDGANPVGGLVQARDGNFYGTTTAGGASTSCADGCGTIFKITPGGKLTMLHTFDFTDGATPSGALIQAADGNFYGTTSKGGANGAGTVYKITAEGTLTTLHSFDGTDGADPEAGLVQATNGTFYGTTLVGGAINDGTVLSLAVGLGPFGIVASGLDVEATKVMDVV